MCTSSRSFGQFVLSLLLGLGVTLGGCASTQSLEETRGDVRVNAANIDNLEGRVDRVEGQVDDLARCCGKSKSSCRCSSSSKGNCVPLVVHDPDRPAALQPSSDPCTLEFNMGEVRQTFPMKVTVDTFLTGEGQFAYKHPQTNEICLLDPVPVNFVGGRTEVWIDFHFRGQFGSRIRGENR